MRREVETLLVVAGLLVGLATFPGCSKTVTTTTATAVGASSTSAPVMPSTSSTAQLTLTSATPSTAPAGYVAFPVLVAQYASLLDALEMPGTLPYSVLQSGELTSIFKTLSPEQLKDTRGFRLANGDTVVLVAAPWVPSVEAFTTSCGGDGRDVITYFYNDYGYLVASKDYARTLRNAAIVVGQGQTLEGAIASVKGATGPY
jgi:hypothetical protein